MVARKREGSPGDTSLVGQVTLELVLVLPVLVLLLMAIVQFGLVMNTQLLLQFSAREGARWVATGRDASQLQERVEAVMRNRPVDVTMTIEGPWGRRLVTVGVRHDQSIWVPILNTILRGPLSLDASATMLIED